jgi:hypothetical protein
MAHSRRGWQSSGARATEGTTATNRNLTDETEKQMMLHRRPHGHRSYEQVHFPSLDSVTVLDHILFSSIPVLVLAGAKFARKMTRTSQQVPPVHMAVDHVALGFHGRLGVRHTEGPGAKYRRFYIDAHTDAHLPHVVQ